MVSAASGYPSNGYCVGAQYWLVPDRNRGLTVWDCGVNQCQPDGAGGGSCTCGQPGTALPELTFDGFCVPQANAPAGFADREVLWTCFGNRTFYDNCKATTGTATGVCQTLVSSFGYRSNCYCAVCTKYDPQTRVCSPACTSPIPTCSTGPNGTFSCFQ